MSTHPSHTLRTPADIAEAERVHRAILHEVSVLQTLNAKLARRIKHAKKSLKTASSKSRGTLHLAPKEASHEAALITTPLIGHTPSPHNAAP